MIRTFTRLTFLACATALAGGAALAQEGTNPPAQQSIADESMLNMLTMRAGAEAMQQTLMKTEMTGDPSGDFLRMMIPHHQSAVAMVDVLLQQKDIAPDVRAMAEAMRAAQMKEIGEMQKALEAYGR